MAQVVVNERQFNILKGLMLKEGFGDSALQNVIDSLMQLVESGWIPFASPSPSSTEQVVKDNVLQAIECLKKAQSAAMSLYG